MSSCEDSHLKDGAVPPIFNGTPPCTTQQQPPPLIKRLDLPMLSQQRNVLGNGMPVSNTMNASHQQQLQFSSSASSVDTTKYPSTVVQHKPGNAACKFESPHHQQGFHSFMQGLPNLPFFNTDIPTVTGTYSVGQKSFIQKQPVTAAMFNYNHQTPIHPAHAAAAASMQTATRPKQLQLLHVPVPVQYYRPQSPSFSDLSSIMLASPLSPAGSTLSGTTAAGSGNGTSDPQHLRSFLLSKRNATLPPLSNAGDSLGTNPPSTISYDDDLAPQPVTSNLSPFFSDSTTDASSTCTSVSSRKRPHSGSPMSDLSEFGSIIRASPNSVIAFLGQNQPPGIFSLQSGQATNGSSMGHLIGQNNHLTATPYQHHHYMLKEQETLIEQNQSFSHGNMDMKITNRITFSERRPPPPATVISNSVVKSEVIQQGAGLPSDMNYLSSMDTDDSSNQERLVCQWKGCFLQFNSVVDLVQHLEKVHIEKGTAENFVCLWNDCPRKLKPFNARYKLIIHMRIHSGEKPNKCPYAGCSKAFSRLENLKIHIRTHTGEKPYTCQYTGCTKSFSNSSDRSKHQKTHYEEKPYACTYHGCEKRYTDPSSLRKHARSHSQKTKARKENLGGLLHIQGIHQSDRKSKMKGSPTTHFPSSTGNNTTNCLSHPQDPPVFSSPTPENSNLGFPPISHQSTDVVYHNNSSSISSSQFHHVTSPPTHPPLQHPSSLSTSFSPLDSTSNSPQQIFNTPQQPRQHGSTSDSSSIAGDLHSNLQPISPTAVNMNISSLKEPVPPISSMHLPKYSDPSNFSQPYIPEYVAAPPPTYEDSFQHTYIPQYTYSTNQIQDQSTVVPELCHFN